MKRNACTDGCGPARHGHRPNVPQQGLRGGCQGYLEAAAPSVQYRTITTDGLSVQLHRNPGAIPRQAGRKADHRRMSQEMTQEVTQEVIQEMPHPFFLEVDSRISLRDVICR